jgi:hypothetical protein
VYSFVPDHFRFLRTSSSSSFSRVDGLLFINLTDDEWPDMGITNRVHVRKLQLILKAFRIRYQRKRDKIEVDEDDDVVSEISPSELSDMIMAENNADDDYSSSEESSVCSIALCLCVWYCVAE